MKKFIYNKVKEIGKINDLLVEIGYYMVDGRKTQEKVYLVQYYTHKNGEEDSIEHAICKVEDAKQLGELLININKADECQISKR